MDLDLHYLVLPDGCVDIVFDISETPEFDGALIMTPAITAETLNLGRSFSYMGVRLRPGAWQTSLQEIIGQTQYTSNLAGCDLRMVRQQLATSSSVEGAHVLKQTMLDLEKRGIVGSNALVESLTFGSPGIVADFAATLGCTQRHLQRVLPISVGYKPHDFLKIIRFQQALRQKTFQVYADQSHYIREFKRITGMTPGAFHAVYG